MKPKVKIRKTLDGHQVEFKIDNQTFYLGEQLSEKGMTSYEYAKWYKKQLETAFEKLESCADNDKMPTDEELRKCAVGYYAGEPNGTIKRKKITAWERGAKWLKHKLTSKA